MNYYEQWDSETERSFTIPEFDLTSTETAEEFALRNRDAITRALSESVFIMAEHGYSRVPILTIKGEDVVFYLDESEFKRSVEQCIEYFTEIEEYEKCMELNNLKKKDDEKTK
jgi:hypothetical protein